MVVQRRNSSLIGSFCCAAGYPRADQAGELLGGKPSS
jgi:hypothetical protein